MGTQNIHYNLLTSDDKFEIIQKQASIMTYADEKRWDDLINNVLSDEVLVDYSSWTGLPAAKVTAQQMVDSMKTILPGFDLTQHLMTNQIIENVLPIDTKSSDLDQKKNSSGSSYSESSEKIKVIVNCYVTAFHLLRNTPQSSGENTKKGETWIVRGKYQHTFEKIPNRGWRCNAVVMHKFYEEGNLDLYKDAMDIMKSKSC